MSNSRTEEMIAALEASGDYKVLRRLSVGNPLAEAPRGTRRAVVADVETTGLDCETNEIIEVAMASGFFYDKHRAVHDCNATIELLGRPLPISGHSALSTLLQSARGKTYRCWALNSPFETKDELKQRGYRWNGREDGTPRSWWIDVPEDALTSELTYLRGAIYKRHVDPPIAEITAFNRHSGRIRPAM